MGAEPPKQEFGNTTLGKTDVPSYEENTLETNDREKQGPSFKNLEKSYENDEGIKQILDSFSSYIDIKLEGNFTDTEKDSIRLTLLNDIFNTFNVNSLAQNVLGAFLKPLASILTDLKTETDLGIKVERVSGKLNSISDSFSSTMGKLGLQSKVDEIDAKITKINSERKTNPDKDFSEPQKIQGLLDSKNVTDISKEAIMISLKGKLNLLSGKITTGKEMGEEILNVINKAPFGKTAIEWLKGVAKESPLLGFIFGLIFGKEFLDEGSNKMKASTENLKKFINSNDFPLRDNINIKGAEKLNSKQLSKFYKFLDNKTPPEGGNKIDYTRDIFWKELLSGNSKNKQINDLHVLLKGDDGKVLDNDEGIEELVKKLNGLEVRDKDFTRAALNNRENVLKEQLAKINKAKAELSSTKKSSAITESITSNNTTKTTVATIAAVKSGTTAKAEANTGATNATSIKSEESTEVTTDKIPQITTNKENTEESEIIKELQEIAFKKSVEDITFLPTKIEYGGDEIDINILDNKIILGGKKYDIDLLYTGEKNFKVKPGDDLFKRVTFNDGELKIVSRLGGGLMKLSEKSETISRGQLVEVLENLMMKSEYKKSLAGVDIDINITELV